MVLNQLFIAQDYHVNGIGTLYRNPAILHIIREMWFRDEEALAVIHRTLFEDNGGLKLEITALVATTVSACLLILMLY